MSPIHVRLIIVGGGPAGLTAAIYAGRAGLAPVVAMGQVEDQLMPGGQLMITTDIENYPGFPEGIKGPELMDRMMAQARKFGAQLIEEWATDFQLTRQGPHQVTLGSDTYTCDAMILANGASAKWLNLPQENLYRNHGISACATCDGPLPVFRNQPLYVVGGGDSACEEALFLARFASEVTIIHRRDTLRASKIMADRIMSHPKIHVLRNTVIDGYQGHESHDPAAPTTHRRLIGLCLRNVVTNAIFTVQTSGLFMAIGHEPLTKGLEMSGLLTHDGYIAVTHDHVYTRLEAVFTCGDVHDTMYRQAITASGFGCMAAMAAERWLTQEHGSSRAVVTADGSSA